MLKTNVMNRGEGKTTRVIQMMKEDKKAILVVPVSSMRNTYPEELRSRIETFNTVNTVINGLFRGKRFSKFIIDEGFLANKEKLAHLYYTLGQNHIETIVFGTE